MLMSLIKLNITIAIILIASGCSTTLKQTQTGFLDDYSQLKPSSEYENTKIYRSASLNKETLAAISKFQIKPFEVWLNAEQSSSVNTNVIEDIHQYFHKQLTAKLGELYEITDNPDKGTLIVRGAFSGLKLTDPEMSAADFIPIRLVFNAGKSAYLNATNQKSMVSEVSIEVEFLLGENNPRVFAMTASKQLEVLVEQTPESNAAALKQVLDIWINNFVSKLSEIKQNK